MAQPGALAHIDTDAILERIAAGEIAAHIAASLNVSRQALYAHLNPLPNYAEAQKDGQAARLQAIVTQFEKLGIPPPPIRPIKRADGAQEDHAVAMEQYRSDYETWRGNCTVNDFELSRLEKLWKAESWRAERAHPAQWGPKGMLGIFANISLDAVLAEMERLTERPPIEGEVSTVEDQSGREDRP